MYRTIKRLGIPDSHIVMMISDGMSCDALNPVPGQVFNDERQAVNVYGTDIEVDYRGYEVSAEALMRVLTGRHSPSTPMSKRLLSDSGSNILIYLTGHGGDEFLKYIVLFWFSLCLPLFLKGFLLFLFLCLAFCKILLTFYNE